MPEKPIFAYEYRSEQMELVRKTCLYVATKLGDLLDNIAVVGGLVPSLLIPKESLSETEEAHVLDEQDTKQALKILQRDFSDPDGIGPRRVAEFLYAGLNEELQADVVGFVRELLVRFDIP